MVHAKCFSSICKADASFYNEGLGEEIRAEIQEIRQYGDSYISWEGVGELVVANQQIARHRNAADFEVWTQVGVTICDALADVDEVIIRHGEGTIPLALSTTRALWLRARYIAHGGRASDPLADREFFDRAKSRYSCWDPDYLGISNARFDDAHRYLKHVLAACEECVAFISSD